MILNLPYDIKWSIASYLHDLDLRRHFNIFKKIDLNKFDVLNRTIRKNMPCNSKHLKQNHTFARCNFHKNFEDSHLSICNDFMDIFIDIYDSKVSYKLYIYKLKKKSEDLQTNLQYEEKIPDYYWHRITIEYFNN